MARDYRTWNLTQYQPTASVSALSRPLMGARLSLLGLPDFSKCDAFVRSLLSYDHSEIPSLLTEFFFAYVENTYFSQAWWCAALSEPSKRRLTSLAGIPVFYGRPLRYSGLKHVDWELARSDVSFV